MIVQAIEQHTHDDLLCTDSTSIFMNQLIKQYNDGSRKRIDSLFTQLIEMINVHFSGLLYQDGLLQPEIVEGVPKTYLVDLFQLSADNVLNVGLYIFSSKAINNRTWDELNYFDLSNIIDKQRTFIYNGCFGKPKSSNIKIDVFVKDS